MWGMHPQFLRDIESFLGIHGNLYCRASQVFTMLGCI